MNKSLSKYKNRVRDFDHLSIFQEAWYLESLCTEGNITWIEKVELEETFIWPIYLKKKWGFRYISMPHLCKWMGPISTNPISLPPISFSNLKSKFPTYDYFEQNIPYTFYNSLEIGTESSYLTKCFSYELNLTPPLLEIYSNLNSDYRNNKLPKAEKLHMVLDDEISQMVDLQFSSYQYGDYNPPFDKSFLTRHIETILSHKQGRVMSLYNDEKKIAAAIFLIWDAERAYYHLAGMDPNLRKTGASIRLIWESIKYAKEVLRLGVYDFEGSMIPSIERVRVNFGGKKKYYWKLKHNNSKAFKLLSNIRRT